MKNLTDKKRIFAIFALELLIFILRNMAKGKAITYQLQLLSWTLTTNQIEETPIFLIKPNLAQKR